MEMRECKLCFKTFANGRALGGHMRSHMKKLPLPSKPEESRSPSPTLLSFENDSTSSSSSSEDEGDTDLRYVLRDDRKRRIRIVDPEFSFVVDPNGSVIQDRESDTETESSKKPTQKRSKRARKIGSFDEDDDYCHKKIQQQETVAKVKSNELCKTEPWIAEAEPASSISDTTTEEDVAYWLMMLSRDKWRRQNDLKDQYNVVEEDEDKDEDEEEDEDEEDDGDESEAAFKLLKSKNYGKYTCETCKKVFRSYQALGGHRASHKKIKVELENHNNGGTSSFSSTFHQKIHECPVCFRVFTSGQALGGHKRTHFSGSSTLLPTRVSTKQVGNFIDLNLPAPTADEDDISQIEFSGVSDAEFLIDRIRQ